MNSTVSIYPNPTNDKCRITFNDNNLKTISVSDVLGKEVFRVSVKANSYLFNTEKFAEGIYTISIINDGTVASGRLLIKH